MRIVFFFILFLSAIPAFAGHLHRERWYQDRWCSEQGGETEVVMPDRSRCDCLTNTHAIEFDFGQKWAEAIGQALLYGAHTGKRPGIALIIENEKEQKYINRVSRVIEEYNLPIDVFIIKP